ncbi:hypothetical protein AAGG74_16100 [Bacillus mexicanus]|uniref:hypothetical protein n=1 Tax=Bacillus mexicanus TaxID=2834415 RepID=UPI003D1E00A7
MTSSFLEKIKIYGNEIFDLEISPFEMMQTLHLRSALQESFFEMNIDEQIELLFIDLQVLKNSKAISTHLSRIYQSKNFDHPISEWWWHLDKIANNELKLNGLSVAFKS